MMTQANQNRIETFFSQKHLGYQNEDEYRAITRPPMDATGLPSGMAICNQIAD
jgi:hypothetical protein